MSTGKNPDHCFKSGECATVLNGECPMRPENLIHSLCYSEE